MNELLTPKQLAELLQIPLSGVYRLTHLKAIPVIRLSHRAIRFSRGDVEKWLQERSQPAKGGEDSEGLFEVDGEKRRVRRETYPTLARSDRI